MTQHIHLPLHLMMVLMFRFFLPGHQNRLRMEPEARAEVMKFGKWIFFSTICGFLLFQGDRIILGRAAFGRCALRFALSHGGRDSGGHRLYPDDSGHSHQL